jgi:hypothetical protein
VKSIRFCRYLGLTGMDPKDRAIFGVHVVATMWGDHVRETISKYAASLPTPHEHEPTPEAELHRQPLQQPSPRPWGMGPGSVPYAWRQFQSGLWMGLSDSTRQTRHPSRLQTLLSQQRRLRGLIACSAVIRRPRSRSTMNAQRGCIKCGGFHVVAAAAMGAAGSIWWNGVRRGSRVKV